jgi:trans-aconitate methyltransferase
MWDPATYLDEMHDEIPGYEALQDAVAEVATGRTILELGVGTGETAARVLARNPGAAYTAIDSSEAMLAAARARLPESADLRLQRLEDPLPEGHSTSSCRCSRSTISTETVSAHCSPKCHA